MSAQLEDLPMELLLIIFQHLPVKSTKNCLAFSRYGFYYIKFLIKCLVKFRSFRRWRQVGLECLGSSIVTLKPGYWKEVLSSEIIKHVGKFRFRGWTHDVCHRAIEVNDVMELIMARDDLNYHSIGSTQSWSQINCYSTRKIS